MPNTHCLQDPGLNDLFLVQICQRKWSLSHTKTEFLLRSESSNIMIWFFFIFRMNFLDKHGRNCACRQTGAGAYLGYLARRNCLFTRMTLVFQDERQYKQNVSFSILSLQMGRNSDGTLTRNMLRILIRCVFQYGVPDRNIEQSEPLIFLMHSLGNSLVRGITWRRPEIWYSNCHRGFLDAT